MAQTTPETKPDSVRPNDRNIYDKLASEANRYRWSRELHNIIISAPPQAPKNDSISTSYSVRNFASYSGLLIGTIKIRQLKVFGPTVDDTTIQTKTWIESTANKIHARTREFLIRNNLIFKEGEQLDPLVLADNERLLRNLPYIEDARIIIKPREETPDVVDILVITKDVWALAFDINVDKVNSGQVEIWDRNIFGMGQEYQNNIIWDTQKLPSTGYEGIYKVNNIAGSFVNGTFSYLNSFNVKTYEMGVERSFYTPNIKYAGGITMTHSESLVSSSDSTKPLQPLSYNGYDYWIGRSFKFRNNDDLSNMRKSITVSGRVIKNFFFERPQVQINSLYDYQDKILYLTSVSFTRQTYYKSNYIYNFGRTEDIAEGGEASLTGGYELNEFKNRRYLGLSLARSFFGDYGYCFVNHQISSFFDLNGKAEQSLIQSELRYFSPLFVYNRYKFREFANFRFTKGVNRFLNEYLTINDDHGITGFSNDSVHGSSRLDMHWETVAFTPWMIYDFKFVAFLSADHVWIGNHKGFYNKMPYTGINFGVRIRNERLVFKTFQIRFSIYPNIPAGTVASFVNLSGEQTLHTYSFLPTYPELQNYR